MPKKEKEISIINSKNVSLVGFKQFDKIEQESVKKVMATYIKKIEERTDYQHLKISLKQHQRNKMFLHEIKADLLLTPGVTLNAEFTHKNPYKAIAQVMIKIINEINHQKRKKIKRVKKIREE
jgi:ribosome-associated translation inhibitor RaiA